MEAAGRAKATALVLPVLLLVVVVILGLVTQNYLVFAALLAAIPPVAASSVGLRPTALICAVCLVAAAGLVLLNGSLVDGLAPLAGVLVAGVIAILISRGRLAAAPAAPAHARHKGSAAHLTTMADTDPLTGLLNRRGAIRALGPRNSGGQMVVSFIDCDGFKQVNEDYGTVVGDEFVQAVAGRLRHRLPAHDIVARWDGDEFLVAISGDVTSVRPALQRVADTISAQAIRTAAGPIPASVCVGAAVWTSGQELEDAIARSGRALFAAKAAGSGRIVVDGEPPEA